MVIKVQHGEDGIGVLHYSSGYKLRVIKLNEPATLTHIEMNTSKIDPKNQ